ncbi:MAG: A/G-specific adenine glycosylase [Chitinophagaceae bacterium]|nr:A/G-specific adenine glycosylase [Chitinophagaceae bacterium]MBL0054841.1 A/G-specific adenine glycosylase [Chitinophagaceae bacterium]
MNQKEKDIFFTDRLMYWHRVDNKRDMPWKGEHDPYRIWISEIILQQTRVEQGTGYYHRFIKAFPTVEKLAKAADDKVFKLWEGLGYYTRCRNLIRAARLIHTEMENVFPASYECILALPGVGPYTAAAISSFAFNLPHAVVDGNVFRVLSRFFGITEPIDTASGKKNFSDLANRLIDKKRPGSFNQAIMDLGAVICKPRLPSCDQCPLKIHCTAYLKDRIAALPVKGKKPERIERYFYYLVIRYNDKVYVRKRKGQDVWKDLYEFVLFEENRPVSMSRLKKLTFIPDKTGLATCRVTGISETHIQQLTHQTITARFIELRSNSPVSIPGYRAVKPSALLKLPFPKLITHYFKSIG